MVKNYGESNPQTALSPNPQIWGKAFVQKRSQKRTAAAENLEDVDTVDGSEIPNNPLQMVLDKTLYKFMA